MTTLNLIPEENERTNSRNQNPSRLSSKSMESLYSIASSKYSVSANMLLRRRANNQRLANSHVAPSSSEIRQRVVSARVLRMKSLQNQLTDAQQQISDLLSENRVLRTLHKRQDNALSKYESTNAELPQLLNSHAEEIRIWQTKYKHIQTQFRELNSKMKQKESNILVLTDQNKHLIQLNKDKNLEEREKLSERVKDLESRLLEKDNDYKLLSRRLQLETKGFKSQLTAETSKQKELVQKLDNSNAEILRLRAAIEEFEKQFKLNGPRNFGNMKIIRQREHKAIMSSTSLLLSETNANDSSSHLTSMITSNTSLLPLFKEKSTYPDIIETKSSSSNELRYNKLEKHEFSFRQKSIQPKRTLKDLHRQQSNTKQNGNVKEKLELIKSNNVDSTTDDEAVSHEPHVTNHNRVNLTMMVMNGMNKGVDRVKSSCTSSEQDNENDDLYSDIENGDSAIESTSGKDLEKENGEVSEESRPSTKTDDIKELENKEDVNTPHSDDSKSSLEKSSDTEIEKLKVNYKTEIEQRENILDEICNDFSSASTPTKTTKLTVNSKSKIYQNTKKTLIDPKKKSKLLAALKAIDSNESFDS